MLDPGSRESLTEQLRPPAGYRLSQAVGTTFTLDMVSALAVPLSFVRGAGEDPANAVAVLNAIRKVSARIDVFCQAGLIRAPRHASDLLAVLEPMVHQVLPSSPTGLFHPKVWLLEFECDGDLAYRFLCSSRNLTPDATWDLLVRLDGRPRDESDTGGPASTGEALDHGEAIPVDNGPLARFIEALPELATVPLPADRTRAIRSLARRTASVRWDLPQDIRTFAFRPLGTGETHPPNSLVGLLRDPDSAIGLNGHAGERRGFGAKRLLVSPFVDDATLGILTGSGASFLRVYGRGHELDRLAPGTLLNPRAHFSAIDEIGLNPDEETETGTSPAAGDLRGLHAKAFFTDFDHTTHALIGSANATQAAFGRNTEFSVELTGPKSRIGTDKIVESLKNLPFVDFTGPGGAERSASEEAEWRLQNALISAAAHTYSLDATRDSVDDYRVSLEYAYSPPRDMSARLGLLTLPAQLAAVPADAGTHRHVFAGLPLALVTPYVLIELRDSASGLVRSAVAQGVLRTDVDGRIEHIVASQLDTPEKLREFLLLFLTPEDQTPIGGGGLFAGQFGTVGAGGSFSGLFEAVAAAATSPDAATLFADLKPVMDRLYRMSPREPEIEEVRLLWEAAVAAVGESQ